MNSETGGAWTFAILRAKQGSFDATVVHMSTRTYPNCRDTERIAAAVMKDCHVLKGYDYWYHVFNPHAGGTATAE